MLHGSLTVLARFFLSAVFLASGVNKLFHWDETERALTAVLCDWQGHVIYADQAGDCIAFLLPWTPVLLIVATLFELVGGLLVLVGIKEKFGAFLLILFLIPTTVLFHHFWFIDGPAREMQVVMFLKNLAILGGLLMIFLHGGQGKSKDPFSSFGP